MTVVTFTLLWLALTSFIIRIRFVNTHRFFLFLRKPLISFLIMTIATLTTGAICYQYFLIRISDTSWFNLLFLIINITVLTASFFYAFCMLKGPHASLYLTICISTLRIDIDRKYIPVNSSIHSLIKIADTFSEQMISLHQIPCKTITFESHLLTSRIREVIADRLKQAGISFHCEERRTPWCEVIVLNLRYGGKTRYRLFTFKKHANGFRVRRMGSSFKINVKQRY